MRFDTGMIPEILFGRLAEYNGWKGLEQRRLPAYDIPLQLRELDANLRSAPVFELRDETGHRAIRIGPHVLSYHQLAPYVGWQAFKPELTRATEALFATADRLTLKRMGFRYLNAWRSDVHGIGSIRDLDLSISVDREVLAGNVNLNFTTDVSAHDSCTVRIATTDFTQGTLPPTTSVMVDVDVFTKEPIQVKSEAEAKAWLEVAHTAEKTQCFRLLRVETIEALKEE